MKKNKSLRHALVIYWLLLLYVIAALIWWFVTLEKQNQQIYKGETNILLTGSAPPFSKEINYQLTQLEVQKKRRTAKHVGEGVIFLLIIGIGAFFLYRLVKRQWSLSKQQQNFIMAVTHELKTPIAITKLNIETIQKRALEISKQEKLLTNSLVEINRLDELVSNILIVSQLEDSEFKMQYEIIHLSDVLNQLIDKLKQQPLQHQINADITSNIYFVGDLFMLKLSISNLVNNALKYSSSGSTITILLKEMNNVINIQVKDEGIGISHSEKQYLFQKFYRSNNELTRFKKGTGLGLYLSNKIVHYHKGTITHTDNLPKGSIFTITLPAYANR